MKHSVGFSGNIIACEQWLHILDELSIVPSPWTLSGVCPP